MERGLDHDPRGLKNNAEAARPTRPRPAPPPAFRLPNGPRREPVTARGRTYHLRGTESRTLEAVGTFRVAFTRDLTIGVYTGDRGRLAGDLTHLTRSGLLERRPFGRHAQGEPLEIVALTPTGAALLEAHRTERPEGDMKVQAVHHGFVRPAELLHDATLYRLYLTEADRLAREGGVVHRVVLDHELKGDLHRVAHIDGCASPEDREAALERAARSLDLPLVDGHVQIPDLRLEIEDAAGHRTRVDLELATEAYRPSHLRAKARAGFAIYRAVGIGRGRAAIALHVDTGGRGGAGFDPDLASSLLAL